MSLKLYNTLGREKQEFVPADKKTAKLYCCGPTVYFYQHIGNLRAYVFEDVLRRTLRWNNLKVNHVMNLTDVGHLTSDDDEGEDKIELAAKKEGKTAEEISSFYAEQFFTDSKKLNIERPETVARATDHIADMIDLIKKTETAGYTYETPEVLYFDTSKFPEYEKLAKLDLSGLKEGARVESDPNRKNPSDFVLWFKALGKHKNHVLRWESPWGEGFPGWHIECSAMGIKYLGEQIDIHCGGIDHIPVHHTNERAQNFAGTGKEVVHFWLHNDFLVVDDQKMSKSLKNLYTISDLEEKDFSPLAYRYFLLGTHYRHKANFTWEALGSAQNAYDKLINQLSQFNNHDGKINNTWKEKFTEAINDDLNTPQALAVIWELLKDESIEDSSKLATVLEFDKVLGLGLAEKIEEKLDVPGEVKKLVAEREEARKNKDWDEADKLRDKIKDLGYQVKDTDSGPKILKT